MQQGISLDYSCKNAAWVFRGSFKSQDLLGTAAPSATELNCYLRIKLLLMILFVKFKHILTLGMQLYIQNNFQMVLVSWLINPKGMSSPISSVTWVFMVGYP
ncbi:hypothetical protein SLEP1_g54379 [Rubroshorea leprosula]|uniref:Uncharacterized protein n=1 Tax=Rubroshorea leprosula TaxID=152421 RepID=A0AAV5MCD1_9ROSI|nr:hypothetical protein SLEP1_g54379 [Rubroshorea leprosula]